MRILLLIMHIIMQKLTLTYKGLRSRSEAMFMNIKNSRELWYIAGDNELAINVRSYALQELARRNQI